MRSLLLALAGLLLPTDGLSARSGEDAHLPEGGFGDRRAPEQLDMAAIETSLEANGSGAAGAKEHGGDSSAGEL